MAHPVMSPDGPGWQLDPAEGFASIRLVPAGADAWAAVTANGLPYVLAPVDAVGDRASVEVVRSISSARGAASRETSIRVEGRRVIPHWSAFRSGPRFRRAVLTSAVLGVGSLVAVILVAAAARVAGIGVLATIAPAIAVFIVFGAASIPFRASRAVHTEYRLVVGDADAGGWLIAQAAGHVEVAPGGPGVLAARTGARVPSWPGEAAAVAAAEDADVVGILATRKADTGYFSMWSGELWLLPDRLLFADTGLIGAFSPGMNATEGTVRRFTATELASMAAAKHSRAVALGDIAEARVSSGPMYHRVTYRRRDGASGRFLWSRAAGLPPAFVLGLQQALGDRLTVGR